MRLLQPAYRDRPPEPERYTEAVTRYAHLVESDRRRRQLLAMGPGASVQTAEPARPRWVGLVVDAVGILAWTELVVLVAVGYWWVMPAAIAHVGYLWLCCRGLRR